MKRTYQPSKRKRVRRHGFRSYMKTKSGRAIIKRKRRKGRWKLVPDGADAKYKRHTTQHPWKRRSKKDKRIARLQKQEELKKLKLKEGEATQVS